jgi:hypothetical protein
MGALLRELFLSLLVFAGIFNVKSLYNNNYTLF